MKRILKQVAGIDVAKDELVVCLGRVYEDLSQDLFARKVFVNDNKGIAALRQWIQGFAVPDIEFVFVMEATGVYHERLAYDLASDGCLVSIVLPNKISNYVRTLTVKTVTDKTASEAIARFGLERQLELWTRPDPVYHRLRQLTRERNQVIDSRTVAKNQLHAEKHEAVPNLKTIKRTNQLIAFLDKQEKEISKEITALIRESKQILEAVNILTSIPGVGELTAATVLAETTGFDLIKNKKQLTSFAGLDIVEKQSGTSIKGKPRISKRGNTYLRKALHLPALAAIRFNERYKDFFARLVSKHGIKMKAVVAVQRKLLELMYSLFKTKTAYDKNYLAETKKLGSDTITP
jgi:transposase